MGHRPRAKPKRLASKLLTIRQRLGLSQAQIGNLLGFKVSYARVCEYEKGRREPSLPVLLRYARLAHVCTCALIDDDEEIDRRHSPH